MVKTSPDKDQWCRPAQLWFPPPRQVFLHSQKRVSWSRKQEHLSLLPPCCIRDKHLTETKYHPQHHLMAPAQARVCTGQLAPQQGEMARNQPFAQIRPAALPRSVLYILFLILPFLAAPRPNAVLRSSCTRCRFLPFSRFRPPFCRKFCLATLFLCFRICCLLFSSECTFPCWEPCFPGEGASRLPPAGGMSYSKFSPCSAPHTHLPLVPGCWVRD